MYRYPQALLICLALLTLVACGRSDPETSSAEAPPTEAQVSAEVESLRILVDRANTSGYIAHQGSDLAKMQREIDKIEAIRGRAVEWENDATTIGWSPVQIRTAYETMKLDQLLVLQRNLVNRHRILKATR